MSTHSSMLFEVRFVGACNLALARTHHHPKFQVNFKLRSSSAPASAPNRPSSASPYRSPTSATYTCFTHVGLCVVQVPCLGSFFLPTVFSRRTCSITSIFLCF